MHIEKTKGRVKNYCALPFLFFFLCSYFPDAAVNLHDLLTFAFLHINETHHSHVNRCICLTLKMTLCVDPCDPARPCRRE